jgi:hypothetical protein
MGRVADDPSIDSSVVLWLCWWRVLSINYISSIMLMMVIIIEVNTQTSRKHHASFY